MELSDAAQALLDTCNSTGEFCWACGKRKGRHTADCAGEALRAALTAASPGDSSIVNDMVGAIDEHLSRGNDPVRAGADPTEVARLYAENSVELLVKARSALRLVAASPPAPTDDDRVGAVVAAARAWASMAEVCSCESTPEGEALLDAVNALDGPTDLMIVAGLCPVCGNWPGNCDPQVDHGRQT